MTAKPEPVAGSSTPATTTRRTMKLQEIADTLLSLASYSDVLPTGHESEAPARLILTTEEHDALREAQGFITGILGLIEEDDAESR
jgi:hypothetical protein